MKHENNNRKLKNYMIMKNVQLKIAVTNLIYMLLLLAVIVLTILSPLYLDIFQSMELCNQYFSAEKLDETLQKAIEHADHCNEHLSKFKITEEFYTEQN